MSHEITGSNSHHSEHGRNDLISADRVAGTVVYDMAGERLGEIKSIMIDKVSGKVPYVVISFGGILGMGEKHHPLPWDMLEYDTGLDGYRTDMNRDEITNAPSYDSDQLAGFDRGHGDDVDRFYSENARDDGTTKGNRSDLNDGIDRPLGFYSRKAQSMRNGDAGGNGDIDTVGLRAEEEAPGFFSPEQQKARSEMAQIENTVGGGQAVRATEDRISDPSRQ